MPETADADLPDTLEEARDFGRGQPVWSAPFLERRRRRRRKEKEEEEEDKTAAEA